MDNAICSNIGTKFGIVMGWKRVPRNNPLLNLIVYHELNNPSHYYSTTRYKNPIIKAV